MLEIFVQSLKIEGIETGDTLSDPKNLGDL
jgi:hypothetical protein